MSQDAQGSHRVESEDLGGRTEERDTVDPVRHGRADEQRTILKPAKTSAAAVFSLIFGLSALLAVLTVVLAPLALLLSIIGLVLGVVGLKMAKRVGVTGKGVAIGGLVLSVLALVLAVTAVAGVTTFLNNESAVDRLEQRVQDLRDELPSDVNVPQP